MASLDVLPQNWKEKAVICSDPAIQNLGRDEEVLVDDFCPLHPSIIVFKDGKTYQIIDPVYTWLILRALKWPGVITELYTKQYLPESSVSKTPFLY
jgi:hypothetical protein